MHGSEIADAELIVASPPCQAYSYMAMPWSRAKQIARALRGVDKFPEPYSGSRTITELNAIFDACFRLQREASEAAGRRIPMIVENVRGAEDWVGRRAKWNFGSFYLWGDVPALMPRALEATKVAGLADGRFPAGGLAQGALDTQSGRKNPGFRFDGSGKSFQSESVNRQGVKNGNDWFGSGENCSLQRRASSKSSARKAASAKIAKIPLALSSHIARVYKPKAEAA
jgi:hypothetical protein